MNNALQFTEFEAYCDTVSNADLQMRVLGMARAQYSIAKASVGQLDIQWAQEGSGLLSEGAVDRNFVGLLLQVNSRPMLLNGMLIDPNAVVVLQPGSEFCFSCSNPNNWLSVAVPPDLLGLNHGQSTGKPLDSVSVVRPKLATVSKLRTMVLTYLNALSGTPTISTSVAATNRFEDAILRIARQVCFRSDANTVESEQTFAPTKLRHDVIARMAAEMIEESLDGSQSIAGLAERLGVSERTLLAAFRSRYGVTPRSFVQSMRLNRARTLLREAVYPETLVKDVAARCGYWDYGRFAERYRRLFGEFPTETAKKGS